MIHEEFVEMLAHLIDPAIEVGSDEDSACRTM